MSIYDWAKNEVEIARKESLVESGDEEFDYGGACYDSALRAFQSLTKDGHSGASIQITKMILNRMIEGKSLTPIEDTEDVWNFVFYSKEKKRKTFQCKRMSGLFKDVYDDGRVTYNDINSVYAIDLEDKSRFYSGMISKIIDEMFPITMPYMPDDTSKQVGVISFLVDPENGDYDTIGIMYVVLPTGVKINIDRYFKEGSENWVEIDLTEYTNRYNNRIQGSDICDGNEEAISRSF